MEEIEIVSLNHVVPVVVDYFYKEKPCRILVYADYNKGDIIFPEIEDADVAKLLREKVLDILAGRISSGYYNIPEDELETEDELEEYAEIYGEDIPELKREEEENAREP